MRDFFKTVFKYIAFWGKAPSEEPLSRVQKPKPTSKHTPKSSQSEATQKLVRSELNLEQNRVFTVSTYREKSREVVIRDQDKERRVIIGRTIDGNETGILTTHHFKLYLALLELWERAGRPINKNVHFTILKILERLGMTDSGSNYQTTKRRLVNLSETPIRFEESFFTKGSTYTSLRPFQILSYLDIYERKYRTKTGQKTRGYGEFRFHDNILLSLMNNYSHPLYLDVITQFSRHRDLAILLYTYLDRQLAFRRKHEIGLEKLFDRLDLSQKQVQYPSTRKAKLEPVLEEIWSKGRQLSTGILSYLAIGKTKDGKDYKLVCRKRGHIVIPPPERTITADIKDEEWTTLPLEELLDKIGQKRKS